jgi:TPR repeat protein
VFQGIWRMGAATRLKGSIVGAVIVGCALTSACGFQSGAGASRQSRSEATQKSAFVFDDAPNEVVAAGDKALAEKNYSVALQRYEEAAKDANEKVQGTALNRLGELYERGVGVNQDWSRSFDLYQKSAILNNPYGAANLGNALFFALGSDRDLKEALRWAQKGAEGNVPMAINQLGWQYRTGMGVPVDTAEARRRYQRSAELGDATGESQLGWMYAHVEPVDYQLAMQWYKKAAAQNDVTSENNIGFLYENGLGVAQDYSQAASWYQKAAALDYPRAEFHLGNLYALGRGVALDQKRARELIGKASDAGDEDAGRWLSTH